jgi:PAS domain S-box-containing protein
VKSSIRVLHLEDNPLDAELIAVKLRANKLSCELSWVTDKASFESALIGERFDIILCDYTIPGYSGRAALRAASAAQPHAPIIIISGFLGDIDAVECLKVGATDYVLKHQLERLAPAIERALRESEVVRERIAAELALRESEQKLRMLIENSTGLFYSHTPDYRLNYVSPQARFFFDCEPEEALASWAEFLTDNPANRIGIERTERAVQTRQPQPPYELELKTRKGRRLWVEVHESPIVEEGRTTRIVGVATSIDDRKRTERNFETLFELAPDGILMADREGNIILVNRQVESLFGWQRSELIGQPAEILIPINEQAPHPTQRDALWEAPAERSGGAPGLRLHGLHKDGGEIPVEISLTPMETSTGVATVATIRDIRDRVRAETQQIRQQRIVWLRGEFNDIFNRRYPLDVSLRLATQSILSCLKGTVARVWLTDAKDKRLVLHSHAGATSHFDFRRIPLGASKAGKIASFKRPLHTDDISFDPDFRDTEGLASDGIVAFAGHPLIVDEVLTGVIGVFGRERFDKDSLEALASVADLLASEIARRNAEDRLQALNAELEQRIAARTEELAQAKETAEAANRAKSTFLAMMSHEIRTPMNAVVGLAELLEQSVTDGEHKEMLGTLRVASESLLNIINDILDFSKIEAGKLEIVRERDSIASIVGSVQALFLPRAREKGLVLKLDAEDKTADTVLIDVVRVRQILLNLVSNAIKFTDSGSITLRARIADSNNAVVKARIDVIDPGVGMSPEDLANLFRPFTQFDSGNNQRANGTGLGLAISRKLAELMGGSLAIESRLGAGTTATLFLDLQRAEATISTQSPGKPRAGKPQTDGKGQNDENMPWVLIVDDNKLNRVVLLRQINNLGYPADAAASGGEALGLLRHRNYGLILSDCQMPGMDGYQLAREIRRREQAEGKPPIPIVACTAMVQSADVERCYEAGMNDHLFKPATLQQLKEKLQTWIALDNTRTQTDGASAAPDQSRSNGGDSAMVIDRALLLEITGSDEEMAAQFLRGFREQQDHLFLPVKQALDEIDMAAIKAAAHRLKGAARTIGAVRLGDVCERMEAAAKAGDSSRFREVRQAFLREAERLAHYLSKID